MSKHKKKFSFETEAVHGTATSHITSKDLVEPIHMTSTFKFSSSNHGASLFAGTDKGYIYSRIANPTTDLLQEKMTVLENGEAAIAISSGMSAIAAVALTLAKPGDNFISCATVYGGTFAFFNKQLRDLKIKGRLFSPKQCLSGKVIEEHIDASTRFLFLETPANPTLDIMDISLWADIAGRHEIPLVVDNTFATPFLQKPLVLGADLVVHSATKYLGGHGDLIGGIIVGKEKMMDRIKEEYVKHFGPVISPFNAWLILRGIKTLAIRMERHCDNAMKIAKWLNEHPKVLRVFYPGLASHPGHETARKQMNPYGGMLAFEIYGGLTSGRRIMDNVKLCTLAVSLGDCETLIQHPASMTHSTYSKKELEDAGITSGLIRMSVGLENADDIIADLDEALKKVRKG